MRIGEPPATTNPECPRQVLYLTLEDIRRPTAEILAEAERSGATTGDSDDAKSYWIVFEYDDNPLVYELTKNGLGTNLAYERNKLSQQASP